MTNPSTDAPQPKEGSAYTPQGGARRPKDRLPPELTPWRKAFLIAADIIFIIALLFLVWLCAMSLYNPAILPSCICWPYVALAVLLGTLFVDRFLRHKLSMHDARLVDRSEVETLIVDSHNLQNGAGLPDDEFKSEKEYIEGEIQRLESLGPEGWTELQVLSLSQLRVDHLKIRDLVSEANSSIAEIEDYAEDSAYRYDERRAEEWRNTINPLVNIIEDSDVNDKREGAEKRLRSAQKSLLEHIAYYQKNWAEGSKIIGTLMVRSVLAALVLLAAGVMPIFYPGARQLQFYNWAFLGASGAIAASLLALHNSDLPEVGNTEGKQALRRAVIGATLGVFAGVLVYAAITGGLLKGPVFTNTEKPMSDILPVFWGIVSGIIFERVFERIKSGIPRSI